MSSWRDLWAVSRAVHRRRNDGERAEPAADNDAIAARPPAADAAPRRAQASAHGVDASESTRLPPGLNPWAPGQRICDGQFRVERLLGAGGFGAVYVVHDQIALDTAMPGWFLDTALAVKRVPVRSAMEREKLLREVQTWSELPNHPHLLPCRFVRTESAEILMFTHYMTGGSLQTLVNAPQPPELDRLLALADESLAGMMAVHGAGLLHLDLKPSNLLLDDRGTLRIADFGLATERPDSRADVTSTVLVRGMSPRYAPPEQRYGGRPSTASDLYSWAASVLELIAGPSLPLTQRTVERGVRAGAVPMALGEVLHECLEPDARKRPTDVQQIARRLRAISPRTADAPIAGTPIAGPPAAIVRDPAPRTAVWELARRRLLLVRALVDDLRFQALSGAAGPSPRVSRLDQLLNELSAVALSEDQREQGRAPMSQNVRAVRMLEVARTVLRELVGLGYAEASGELADVCSGLEVAQVQLGDWHAALESLTEAERVLREAVRTDPARETRLWNVRRRRCVVLSSSGMRDEALAYISALPIPPIEAHRTAPPELAHIWTLLESDRSVILLTSRRAREALEASDAALARASLTPSSDPLTRATLLLQRGRAFDCSGEPERALRDFAEAGAIYDTHAPADPSASFLADASGALLAQAVTLAACGRAAEALPLAERCVAMREHARSTAPTIQIEHGYAFARKTEGDICRQLGLASQADSAYRAASEVWRELVWTRGQLELKPYLARVESILIGDVLPVPWGPHRKTT